MRYNEKVELLAELNDEAIVYHDIEDALIGYLERFGQRPIAVYDYDKAIECLMIEETEEAYEQAVEWFEHNTLGTWVGEGTPAFLHTFKEYTCEESKEESVRLSDWLMRKGTQITETLRSFGGWWQRDGK